MCGLSLVAASGGYSWLAAGWGAPSHNDGFSSCRAQAPGVWASVVVARGPWSAGSVVVAHGLSCSEAYGIFPDQGSNPCPRLWQVESYPLCHQGSPTELKEMEKEVKYTDSYPQDFPLILLGNTQLGSELAGRPELAEQNLLATELFSFAWVLQKITGEERGHLFRETGASQSVKNKNQKKKKYIYIYTHTHTHKQGRVYLFNIPHIFLEPGWMPPTEKIGFCNYIRINNQLKHLPAPAPPPLPLLKLSQPGAVGQRGDFL